MIFPFIFGVHGGADIIHPYTEECPYLRGLLVEPAMAQTFVRLSFVETRILRF
jgi:hypothetical protein